MAFDFDPEKIRRLRTERAWTQEKLAEVAGVSVRAVQRLEKGICGSFATLQAVAKALGVDVETLRAESGTRRQEPHEERVGALFVLVVSTAASGIHVVQQNPLGAGQQQGRDALFVRLRIGANQGHHIRPLAGGDQAADRRQEPLAGALYRRVD